MNKLIPTNTKREDCVMTPEYLAEAIVRYFNPSGIILEPCKGTGNFMKFLPKETLWCEILEGKDFFDFKEKVNWIITNPPYSKMRKFLQHSMELADNVVFLTTINHLWLKARIRDIEEAGFGIKEIVLCDTPKEFPQSGFQFGIFHLERNYTGNIKFNKLSYCEAKAKEHKIEINSQQNEKVKGNVAYNEVTRPNDFSKEKILDTLKSTSNKRDGSSADTLRGLEDEK